MAISINNGESSPASSSRRLVEVDALRGIAAVLVVLFHYTTRFDEIFGHVSPPAINVPWGHLGVDLFFMISGFVIFMTLDRTRHPLDFVVSRVSRLYPTYWVAVLTTFVVLSVFELPGKTSDLFTAIGNLLMFHNVLGVPHVDGVYWSLEAELFFYALMLVMWLGGKLQQPFVFVAGWLGIRLIYVVASAAFGVDLPYFVSRILVLEFAPYFATGMAIYLALTRPSHKFKAELSAFALALMVIATGEGIAQAGVSAVFAAVLYGAASQKLTLLRLSPLVWLGAISYPLYLVHENIGWTALLRLEAAGFETHVAIAATICLALGIAATLHYAVEKPVMRTIRERYRHRLHKVAEYRAPIWIAGIGAFVIVLSGVGKIFSM